MKTKVTLFSNSIGTYVNVNANVNVNLMSNTGSASVATHLFGTSNFICSRTHTPLLFSGLGLLFLLFILLFYLANPVKPYERCVAPRVLARSPEPEAPDKVLDNNPD